MLTLILFFAVLVGTVSLILFLPSFRIGKVTFDSFWTAPLGGCILLLLTGKMNVTAVGETLIADTAINPLKILVLFISMTLLSIYLDEIGFFSYLACVTLRRAKTSQMKLFLYLYLIVSVLTVFTSNDVIVLSFTPFICYFAKNAGINPLPYLASEFVAANTWSMALIIGNPTNIYIATSAGIGFASYVKVMILPTVAAGAVAFLMLWILFRKSLSEPIHANPGDAKITDKAGLILGVLHLGVCTALLAVGSYIGLEMWIVSLVACVSLFLCVTVLHGVRKKSPGVLLTCLSRAPWQLVPFVLSMFVLILSLGEKGYIARLAELLQDGGGYVFGLSSFLAANLINNIPMSVLYASILSSIPAASAEQIYATVIGSNIGAFLTPIGALAGIMWSSILKKHDVKFGYADFLKIGVTVAIPAILASLTVLNLIV